VFNRYLDVADDDEGVPVLPLFLSLRAAIRAHVTAASAIAQPSDAGDHGRLQVRAYFDLATDLLRPRPPRLVAVGGLSGTGKSTVAAGLAGDLGIAPGGRVLRSDVLRKRLFGLPPESRLPADAYTKSASRRVYAELEARAVAALAAGHSVIIDAVAADAGGRRAFAEIARKSGVAFQGIWLDAPADTLLRRLEARHGDASDATPDVLRQQLTYDLGDMTWTKVDATRSPAVVIAAAKRILQSGTGAS
jgi:predicted kinase